MNLDVGAELATLQTWRHGQPPAPETEATVTGFLWALSLVTGQPADHLRRQLGLGQPSLAESPLTVSPTPAAGAPLPAGALPLTRWRGLGISPIGPRSRTVDPDDPVAGSRAFTTDPDGKPMAVDRSYAERAAEGVASTHNNAP